MEHPGAKPSPSPWICSFLYLLALLPGQWPPSRGLNIISGLATLKQTSVADFPPEFQTQSSCCLAAMPAWVFKRHLKLNTSNACFFPLICTSVNGNSVLAVAQGRASRVLLLCHLSLTLYVCSVTKSFELYLTVYADSSRSSPLPLQPPS